MFARTHTYPRQTREGASILALAEVRHGLIAKPAKSFRMSLGGRKVCTTF
jgi:hypothetical protein